ncbi:phosphate/phosphite/phosphonate ABC transporter substrate-binding protein [Desulfurivibrio alkaliphilus]|uniref:Phosphonate ABC transporter, periplasmic phosphonate-binding protein n=1 Tax=Desulfurivibrio alkaliphilus (strain DSM 19089 / UNIQEM U267 / AHT2) TaxID=589865 RepID=D6Z141_DESAT|nr:phosphate/phosphite/phosphonate ABC transporter substrate-binding protein [Desulfurivibrio alkaliphilus]ADH87301.1 phosphonate ABC transporter, periplasmic phosphonate-binding protein [Desulfurivibrio alkaliphilus AHT 2]
MFYKLLPTFALALALAFSPFIAPVVANASQAPDKITIVAIPDDSADNMRQFFGLIARHIEDATGIPTEYVHVENYAATVTALATGRAQLAWFGAVTTAQAYLMMGDELEVVAARDIDKEFISYFIANADAGIPPVNDLAELAELVQGKNRTFTFGSKSSTSSHLMPRSFFADQSGQRPEQVFRTVAYSGSHDVVLQKVANGEFHLGALGQPPYDRASDELKAKAPIIYTTPKFTNYCFATRKSLGQETIDQIHAALLGLHESDEGRQALDYLKSEGFVDADMSEWMGYVELLKSGVDIGN